jgi:peptidyl-tRNA hydrolase, PTH1 family
VDLLPLVMRVKTGGGTAGHNGLTSIDGSLGAGKTGYHRIRIGVGKPGPARPGQSTADWVLEQFTDQELQGLDRLFDDVVKAAERILRGDAAGAMGEFNGKGQ